jgi:type IV pilus assembly protein PilV
MQIHPGITRSRGFSLIEVLVTVLILSFGISSIGMMMLATLQNARGALFQTKAVGFTQDIAERIRANYGGRMAYQAGVDDMGENNDCFQTSAGLPTSCSPQQLAAHDIWHWKATLRDPALGLPDATGSIVIDDTVDPPQYRITVRWLEAPNPNDPGNPVMASFTLRTLL